MVDHQDDVDFGEELSPSTSAGSAATGYPSSFAVPPPLPLPLPPPPPRTQRPADISASPHHSSFSAIPPYSATTTSSLYPSFLSRILQSTTSRPSSSSSFHLPPPPPSPPPSQLGRASFSISSLCNPISSSTMPANRTNSRPTRRPSSSSSPLNTHSNTNTAAAGPSSKRRKRNDGTAASSTLLGSSPPPLAQADSPGDLVDESSDPLGAVLQKQRADAVKSQQTAPTEKAPSLSTLTCVICMDVPTDLTATACGHLFCHTCLMEALIAGENRANPGEPKRSQCPVCRKTLSRTKQSDIIPLLIMKQGLATQPRKGSDGKIR